MSARVRMLIMLSNSGYDLQEMVNRLNLPLRKVREINELLASARLTKAS